MKKAVLYHSVRSIAFTFLFLASGIMLYALAEVIFTTNASLQQLYVERLEMLFVYTLIGFAPTQLVVTGFSMLKHFFGIRKWLSGYILAVGWQLIIWSVCVFISSFFLDGRASFFIGVPIILLHGIWLNHFDEKLSRTDKY